VRGTAPRATSSCAGRPDRETWPGLFEDHAGFTHVEELAVTIAGQQFPQLLCHFVMVYNRWGHVSVVLARECFSRPSGHAAVRRKITAPTASRWAAERRAGVFADPPHPSATWTLTSVRIFPCVMNAFAGHFGGGASRNNRGEACRNRAVDSPNRHLKAARKQALILRQPRLCPHRGLPAVCRHGCRPTQPACRHCSGRTDLPEAPAAAWKAKPAHLLSVDIDAGRVPDSKGLAQGQPSNTWRCPRISLSLSCIATSGLS